MNVKDLLSLRDASAVRRCHTMRVPGQTLAEHQWGVAMLVLLARPLASATLLRAALVHDLPEYRTGDIPATAKWNHPKLEAELRAIEGEFKEEYGLTVNLDTEDQRLLKWCDKADFALYCFEQLRMGNRYAQEGIYNIMPTLADPPEECGELYYVILQEKKELGQ